MFLTFFTNLVLMACFLGMSVGCLAAARKADYLQWVLPLTLASVVLALGVLWAYQHFERLTIAVDRRPSPQEVFFGTETRPVDPAQFVVPIEAIAGVFFTLIALTFIGLGQASAGRSTTCPSRSGPMPSTSWAAWRGSWLSRRPRGCRHRPRPGSPWSGPWSSCSCRDGRSSNCSPWSCC